MSDMTDKAKNAWEDAKDKGENAKDNADDSYHEGMGRMKEKIDQHKDNNE